MPTLTQRLEKAGDDEEEKDAEVGNGMKLILTFLWKWDEAECRVPSKLTFFGFSALRSTSSRTWCGLTRGVFPVCLA